MVAYRYDTKVAFVKGSPNTVAANASVLVYALTDTGYTTPLTVYEDRELTVIANIVTDAYGIPLTDFYTNNHPDVRWKSGTMTGEWATTQSRPGVQGPVSTVPGPPGPPGADGTPGLNGANGEVSRWATGIAYTVGEVLLNPSGDLAKVTTAHTSTSTYDATKFTTPYDAPVAALVGGSNATAAALVAAFVPRWKANTAYALGEKVISPAGDTVSAKATFTSGASYNAANWDLTPTLAGKLDTATAATTYDPLLLNSQKTIRNRDLFVDAVAEGAATDGTTNAQPQIGSSHNLLPTSGGRVYLRKGSYLMSTRLIVTKQGMVLEGDGIGATTMLLNAAAFQVGASDVLIRNMTIKGNGSNARALFQLVTTGAFKNWRFENVKFDGVSPVVSRIGAVDNTGATITSASGLDSHVEFDHCEFTNYTEDGTLHVRGAHHVTVNRCWFHDAGTDTTKGDLLKLSAGAEYWQVLNSRFTDGQRDAIDCYDAQRGLVQGNTIVNMGVHGIEMKVASATAPNPADRSRVIDNHIVNIGTATASPAMQLAVSNVIATGNLIEGGTSYGMRCGKSTDNVTNSRDIIWTNNHVRGVSNHGYALNGVDGAIIQNNAAINCGGSGFSVPLGATNSLIVGGASSNLSRGNTSADVWT